MAIKIDAELAYAAERWAQDKALMDLLRMQRDAALKQLGDSLDVNTILRTQGMYKSLDEFLKMIEGAASAAHHFRTQRSIPTTPPSFNYR